MLQAAIPDRTRSETSILATSNPLLDTLLNRLVLDNVVPYLSVGSIVNLASTSRDFRSLIYDSPGVFRHLDLSNTKAAQFDIAGIDHGGQVWRNVQLDEHLSEDEFYSGPLRGIFSKLQRRNILRDVQTLVLDGLSVTAELCNEVIVDPTYSVRLLSIREAKNLNHGKLRGSLQYACRPGRAEGTPKLRALYIFGPKDTLTMPTRGKESTTISDEWNQRSHRALSSSLGEEPDSWWSRKGRMISTYVPEEWANCLVACEGTIAFDAVLCRGPRHRNSSALGHTAMDATSPPAVATFSVPPCEGCGTAPEGLINPYDGHLPMGLPLLAPPPLLSSSIRAATDPRLPATGFVPRCRECLRDRYCTTCDKWWCESCYTLPNQADGGQSGPIVADNDEPVDVAVEAQASIRSGNPKPKVTKSCWECGQNCEPCIDRTQRVCRRCCSGYCTVHNEGSSPTHCDWCISRGRGLGRL